MCTGRLTIEAAHAELVVRHRQAPPLTKLMPGDMSAACFGKLGVSPVAGPALIPIGRLRLAGGAVRGAARLDISRISQLASLANRDVFGER